jgi:TonB family protein
MEAVSDILQRRKREPGGLKQTAVISLAAHAVAVAIVLMIPSVVPRAARPPRVMMSISLGGSPGPNAGGLQTIGGKPILAAQPSTDPQIAKPIQPSLAVTPPTMALPDSKQKPRTPPKPTATSKDPAGTAVGKGFETREGTAKVDTGAKGQGFGLSTGGTGGDGGIKVPGDFCCPEYLIDMRDRITKNWNQNQKAAGKVSMSFMIQRNGQITDIEVATTSGNPVLDLAAQRALVNTRMLGALPAGYSGQRLPVELEFVYIR